MTAEKALERCLEELKGTQEMDDITFNSYAVSFKVSTNYNLVVWCDVNDEDDTEDKNRYFIVSIRYNPYDDCFGDDIFNGEVDTSNTSEEELKKAIDYVFSHKDFIKDIETEKRINMEKIIYNLILMLFDDSQEEWKAIDDKEFIHYVCKESGITRDAYKKIMKI